MCVSACISVSLSVKVTLCSPGSLQTSYEDQTGLEFGVIILPQPRESQDSMLHWSLVIEDVQQKQKKRGSHCPWQRKNPFGMPFFSSLKQKVIKSENICQTRFLNIKKRDREIEKL